MNNFKIGPILNKLEEMNTSAADTIRVLPLLLEIVSFVRDAAPILDKIQGFLSGTVEGVSSTFHSADAYADGAEKDKLSVQLDRFFGYVRESNNMVCELMEENKKRQEREKMLILNLAQILDVDDDAGRAMLGNELDTYFESTESDKKFERVSSLQETLQDELISMMSKVNKNDAPEMDHSAAKNLLASIQLKLAGLHARLGAFKDDDTNSEYINIALEMDDQTDMQGLVDAVLNHKAPFVATARGESPAQEDRVTADVDTADLERIVSKGPKGIKVVEKSSDVADSRVKEHE